MIELTFSFTDCAPVLQGPQLVIPAQAPTITAVSVSSDVSDLSDLSDRSGYTVIAEAARDFRGWLTVTAESVIRNVVCAFRRIFCEAKAIFNRHVLIRQGGLRL